MKPVHKVVYLFDLNKQPKKSLKSATDIEVETIFQGIDKLTFTVDITEKIIVEQEIIYNKKRYRINETEEVKTESKTIVTADSVKVELNDNNIEEIAFEGSTLLRAAQKVVEGTDWTIGEVQDTENLGYSMRENNRSSLYLLRELAKLSGLFLEFDTVNRIIHFKKNSGRDLGIVFRYKKNIKEIRKTTISPKATELFLYGRNGLTVENVNDGNKHIEDYSWYLSLGMTIEEAKEKYRKVHTIEDDRYIYPGNLLRAGYEILKELSQPQIAYEVDVSILGLDIKTGDFGYVVDEELGIKVKVRVVRIIEYEDERNNKVEFNYLIDGIHDQRLASSNDSYSREQGKQVLSSVRNDTAVTVGTTYVEVLNLSLSVFNDTHAQFGFNILGESSHPALLDGYFTLSGNKLPLEILQNIPAGWNLIGVPFSVDKIPQGAHDLRLFLKVDNGVFSIAEQKAEVYVISDSLLAAIAPDTPNREIVEEVTAQPNSVVIPITITDSHTIEFDTPPEQV